MECTKCSYDVYHKSSQTTCSVFHKRKVLKLAFSYNCSIFCVITETGVVLLLIQMCVSRLCTISSIMEVLRYTLALCTNVQPVVWGYKRKRKDFQAFSVYSGLFLSTVDQGIYWSVLFIEVVISFKSYPGLESFEVHHKKSS